MSKTIAISRQRGSGGAYIGQAVADRLGFRYVDRQMLHDASEYLCAENAKAEAAATAAPSSWWSRLGDSFGIGAPELGYVPPTSESIYEGELFDMQTKLIAEIVEDRDAVIVGRGAAQTLRGRPGVVSIFLHAPEPWRIARTQQIYSVNAGEAQRLVRESDKERRRFIRAIADIEWTDALAYDLAIDVSTIGLEASIDLVARLATI